MDNELKSVRTSINRGGIQKLKLLLVLTLLLSLTPLPIASTSTSRVQPVLLELAAQHPDQIVSVIVQKTVKDDRVEKAVSAFGGKITADLWIINGFAAELPAKNTVDLAQVSGVRAISWNAPVIKSDCNDCTQTGNLVSTYDKDVRVDKVWNRLQGNGIGVAVVDSGINWQTDLYTIMGANRVVANVSFNSGYNQSTFDNYGHGSHVAGIVGGNGRMSNGMYIGIAPQSNIINVKVGDDLNSGSSTAKNVVQGLQWVLQNKATYNIRVVNLSLNSTMAESYNTNPIDAAVEILWFNKIVVVVSAGNQGSGALYPPANDPFIITVGAVDDKGTQQLSDDVVAPFSAYGTTSDGFAKPDLVAPGKNIVSLMGNTGGGMPTAHPSNIVSVNGSPVYFRLSGTSAAAPVVSGAVALLLQSEPNLNPDQVKYRLKATARTNGWNYSATQAGAGYLDIFAAVNTQTTQSANAGVSVSRLLWTGSTPVTWGSVQWGSVQWGSVQWGSVQWGSDYWGP